MSIFKDIKKKAKKVGKKVKKVIPKPAKKAIDKVKDKVEDTADEAKDEVKKIAKEGRKEIQGLLKSQIATVFKVALNEAYAVLKRTKVVKSFGININFALFTKLVGGGFKIKWNDVGEDKEELLTKIGHLSSSPPTTRSEIKEFIKLLAPDDVEVQISAFEIGLGVDEALDEIDSMLSKVGVLK